MSTATHPVVEFESLEGISNLKISKVCSTPSGHQYRAIVEGNSVIFRSATDPKGGGTIVVTGPTVSALSIAGVITGLLNELADALGKVVKALGCTPTASTTVTLDKDGKVTSITSTATCAPN
jgi:hypothetical protein